VTVTRRKLILIVLTVPGLDVSSLSGLFGGRTSEVLTRAASDSTDSTRRAISGAEVEDLVAFAEALVGAAPLSRPEREHLVDHIEHRAKQGSGYYLDLYRTTVHLLNRLAGARLSSLDLPRRAALMTRHRLMVSDVRPGERLGPFAEDARAVRTRTVPDLIGGYYGSPAGWAAVAYGDFPGKCGDLTRYTRAES